MFWTKVARNDQPVLGSLISPVLLSICEMTQQWAQSKDLEDFIAGAFAKNWKLRTLDTYPTD